jgi:tRNA-specific 2-thiouridylase
MKQRILLGMSGGTDSSVAAILLLEQGYEVTGISFQFWEETDNQHLDDAKTLAKQLGIEHISYDARAIFKEKIVDYFVDEYLQGRTPFPCAKCNNELKWNLILLEANRLGCEKVAMGHYVQIVSENGLLYIAEGVDPDKDQSFFLWGLNQEQLARIVFPMGKLYKTDIRKMAAQKGWLKVAEKKDSLGTCFCTGDYRDFLVSQLKEPNKYIFEGEFIDESGNILGQHKGYPFYTVGQRRGLIHLNRKVFVKKIHTKTNQIVLAPLKNMYKTQFDIQNINIVDRTQFLENFDTIVRIRYRKQNTLCRVIFKNQNEATVLLSEPLESIAPGQTAVFYRNGKVLGGGFVQ